MEPERDKHAIQDCVDFSVALCFAIGLVIINVDPLELFLGQFLIMFIPCLFSSLHSLYVIFFAFLGFVMIEMPPFFCIPLIRFPVRNFDFVMF